MDIYIERERRGASRSMLDRWISLLVCDSHLCSSGTGLLHPPLRRTIMYHTCCVYTYLSGVSGKLCNHLQHLVRTSNARENQRERERILCYAIRVWLWACLSAQQSPFVSRIQVCDHTGRIYTYVPGTNANPDHRLVRRTNYGRETERGRYEGCCCSDDQPEVVSQTLLGKLNIDTPPWYNRIRFYIWGDSLSMKKQNL